jgi:hypothetical protein
LQDSLIAIWEDTDAGGFGCGYDLFWSYRIYADINNIKNRLGVATAYDNNLALMSPCYA